MKQNNKLKIIEINSIKVYLLNSKKYKTTCFSFRLSTLINREINTIISTLSYFLLTNTTECKNKKELNRMLEKMYDAKIYASNNNFGNISVLNFVLKTIEQKYTMDENFFENSLKVLVDIIFGKYENKNKFNVEYIEEEKNNIIESMRNLKENKQDYAFYLLLQKMCKNENLSIFSFNNKTFIKNLTLDDIEKVYRELIETATYDLIISGNFEDEEKIIDILKNNIPKYLKSRNHLVVDINNSFKIIKRPKIYQKSISCAQTQIFIGYRTNVNYDTKEFYTQYFSNAILGTYMNSRLFQIVREKYNLCYSTYSFLRPLDKCLFIYAGVDFEKIDQTIEVIKKIIEDLSIKKITSKELKHFKELMINSLKEADDMQYNQIERVYSCEYTNRDYEIQQTIDQLDMIKPLNILNYFKNIQLDTIFVLKGDQDV